MDSDEDIVFEIMDFILLECQISGESIFNSKCLMKIFQIGASQLRVTRHRFL